MWWASKSTKTHVPILKGLTITQVRDVGGFDIGVMWQSQFKQASVLLEGPFDTVSDYELLELWRTHMAEKSIVGSISTIATNMHGNANVCSNNISNSWHAQG